MITFQGYGHSVNSLKVGVVAIKAILKGESKELQGVDVTEYVINEPSIQ